MTERCTRPDHRITSYNVCYTKLLRFVGGDANQWQPNLFRNTTQIYPFQGKPGWNLVTGMADDAIDYLNRINQIDPRNNFV